MTSNQISLRRSGRGSNVELTELFDLGFDVVDVQRRARLIGLPRHDGEAFW